MRFLAYLLFILHLFSSLTAITQDSIWPIIFDDQVAHEVFEDYDGGFLVLGATIQQNSTNHDYGIIKKTNLNGGQLWQKHIGASTPPGWTIVDEMSRTTEGGYIITGFTRMYNGKGNTFAMKLNCCFEKEWSRVFYSYEGNQASSGIYQLTDGSYLMEIDNWGEPYKKRIWVFKLSSEGDIIWQKSYADTWEPEFDNGEHSTDFVPDNMGNFIINGQYYKQQPETDTNYYWLRPMFIKIDTAGNELWHLVYGLDDFYIGNTYKSCSDNNGIFYSSGYNTNIDGVGGDSPVIYRVNSSGEMDWYLNLAQVSDSVYGARTDDVSIMNDTALYAFGGWGKDGVVEVYVFKSDTAGNLLEKKLLSNIGYFTAGSIITTDNKYVAVGFANADDGSGYFDLHFYKLNAMLEFDTLYTMEITYDSLCPYPILSDTIVLDTLTVNLDRLARDLKCMSIFPNPARDKVRIEINIVKWIERSLKVFNLSGQEVFNSIIPPGRASHEMDVSRLKEGLYIFRLFDEGRMIQSEKLLITRY